MGWESYVYVYNLWISSTEVMVQSSQFLGTKPLAFFYRDCSHVNMISQLCHFLAICPETSYPSSSSLSFLIYK